ncbi:MAG: NADH:ubiquinone oxidoreductase subunit J [Legionella sp.]|nr:MAG: NADH:ubiquinone oxidoreductase subunit J [Legionella sp.]PJD97745.1 MAG: NADH:ubiquinone oxidoreductase subunit J [Legionella sp.]
MNQLLIEVIFYLLAALAIGSAVMVISQNNPVRCVLFLVVTFFASAGLWLLAEAEFLSLILVLVYVGAVMTLFLFVVMMLNIDVESLKGHFLRYMPLGLMLVAFLTGLLIMALPEQTKSPSLPVTTTSQLDVSATHASNAVVSNTEALGLVLYTDYLLAFELAAVILLVAIISAITLVHSGASHSRRQNVVKQIRTRSEDRVSLVSLKSEK